MKSRIGLDNIFRTFTTNVYFQPPETIKMHYPCIRYSLSNINTKVANNLVYKSDKGYQVTVIDKNPDSDIPNKMLTIPKCRFDRFYVADGLNHWVYIIYY